MRKSRFTKSRILAIFGEGKTGLPVAEVCGEHGISTARHYQWKVSVWRSHLAPGGATRDDGVHLS